MAGKVVLKLAHVGLESALVDLEAQAECEGVVEFSWEGSHEAFARFVAFERDELDGVVAGYFAEGLDLVAHRDCEAGEVDDPAVAGERGGRDVLGVDKAGTVRVVRWVLLGVVR